MVTEQSLIPPEILPNEEYPLRDSAGYPLIEERILCAKARELARHETLAVVRVPSRRREGTQADFERAEIEFQAGRRRSTVESFLEHRVGETLSTPFLSSPLSVDDPG